MLNFRKLKQDFSSTILKEGKDLHDKKKVVATKILRFDNDVIRCAGKVLGNYENTYECELEIDRFESILIHSNCDCTYRYDCQHLAAMIYHLEEKLNTILIEYSKNVDLDKDETIDTKQKLELLETIKDVQTQEIAKRDAAYQKQVVEEYRSAAHFLSSSSFFIPHQEGEDIQAEVGLLFNPASLLNKDKNHSNIEFQLSLWLPFRSKPFYVSFLKQFLKALRYQEPVMIASRKCFFSLSSFNEKGATILDILQDHALFSEKNKKDRMQRIGEIDSEMFGILLAEVYKMALEKDGARNFGASDDLPTLPCLFVGNLETPLHYSIAPASLRFELEYIEPPATKILLRPKFFVDRNAISIEEAFILKCPKPGLIYEDVYFRFSENINRKHLEELSYFQKMTIPEPLFGTFVENSLPELKHFGEVVNGEKIEQFVTLPFVGQLGVKCSLTYLDGELEASLRFSYDGLEILAAPSKLTFEQISAFVGTEGILARNLVEEYKIIEGLFQDFDFHQETGTYIVKSEKKIVEFMTEIIPRYQERIEFECPQNLLDQFVYDQTTFVLRLSASSKVGYYILDLKVNGQLKGVPLELLWECVASKRRFIELGGNKKQKKQDSSSPFSKILVLNLETLSKIIQLFDELGIKVLDSYKEERPLWSLVNMEKTLFEGLPVEFSMSKELEEIRSQMLGEKKLTPSPIPKEIQGTLRHYQEEGVYWLERLRMMYLNGILADDMGLGKTLQAIVAVTQLQKRQKTIQCLVICPTSLLFNWKEEIYKFNPHLKVMVVDGIPHTRKKLLETIKDYDIIITSYTLLQKDVEYYQSIVFDYLFLDEAQHIKNRGTRNAKSAKMLQATHRMILTGTPIENSLEELWSLFDFLMPGFLSSFERFVEKYIRVSGPEYQKAMEYLRRKVSPFILRRMKSDVLEDLPPVSEISYHCKLTPTQEELYRSYAISARDELVKMVEREGFEKVQIHVLATLTRLKQICCHPAIFAKEKPESGDSAKYEMLLELLQALIEGNHKTVIFSQYTQMLQIMRDDFKQKAIRFCYLDGSTKNRLDIVKEFNTNEEISVFLVSLKAGGTGLNITGADTVIHYDLWWNPAIENQATDRVYRIGQKKAVSSYKLITSGTIEEKIIEMQKRKKGLVKKVVSCDDEIISKLTWQDVLELLQT